MGADEDKVDEKDDEEVDEKGREAQEVVLLLLQGEEVHPCREA
jgi:hypothetical protein